MKSVKPAIIVILPLVILMTLVAILLQVFIFDKTKNLKQSNLKLHSELTNLRSKIVPMEQISIATPQPFRSWTANSVREASLALQSSVSKLAADIGMSQQLLGPYQDSADEQGMQVFSVEFESETGLKKVAHFLSSLDALSPEVSVDELDIRYIASLDPDVSDTQVYLRVVIQGVYDALSE